LVEQGETPAVVARILGVTRSSLHRWRRMARQGHDLAAKPVPGAKRRLTDPQLRELERLLNQGAPAHGFANELWTAARVAQVIHRHFGVKYHPDYVLRLLRRRLNWTCHKPQTRARECNDKEVERWKADEFPRILREAWRRQAHVAFLDESGFLLEPLLRRTLAPRGQRVVLRCSAKHDRVSAISCVTLSPQARHVGLYFGRWINQNVHGEDVVEFLKYLTQRVPGAWTVVWDRNNIHGRSKAVRAWLAGHPQVVVEDFPAHAPDADPDEWVWGWAKYGKLCNLCPADVEELYQAVLHALEELKHRPCLLASFVVDAGVPLCL
jgi:transposase